MSTVADGSDCHGSGDAGLCGKGNVPDKPTEKMNSFSDLVLFLHQPVDSQCLGVVRALFGLMMVLDVPYERGLHDVEGRFGDPMNCHFPLFHWWAPLPFEYMGLLYLIMWIGAFGMCLGLRFRLSCFMFTVPYWYLFLLEKTAWNNHSYLYGLISILLLFTSAHYSFSVDSLLNPHLQGRPVPLWNYWIIRFQFFLLYFYAGLKKIDPDWIGGHSMETLSIHWVFDPFRVVLTDEQIDLWVIHVFGFVFDLTVGFWLLLDKTRPLAILFCSSFHIMNSRMFHIGQFPYVCLVTTPIFCSYSWPKQVLPWLKPSADAEEKKQPTAKSSIKPKDTKRKSKTATPMSTTLNQKLVVGLLATYVSMQLFLPFSHGLTEGYNNWTNGLYGYSWDMMVHSWDTTLITVTVEDHDTGRQHFIHPDAWVRNTRYTKHADMMVQYASCINRNLASLAQLNGQKELQNISVYIDVWCSLNNRFQQRLVNPRQDLLKADWDPFKKTPWVLPLLNGLTPWRGYISDLHSQVLGWNNRSDSMFVADFPGMEMEHFVRDGLRNVTLTVLQGSVSVKRGKSALILVQGESVAVKTGKFHKVVTTSKEPSCFVYTYIGGTTNEEPSKGSGSQKPHELFAGFDTRWHHLRLSFNVLWSCFQKIAANFGLF